MKTNMTLFTKKLPASLGMVFALAGGLPLSGCISGSDNVDVTLNVAQPTGTITGKLIDGATRQPITNADVALIVNGEKRIAKSSASADPDLAGIFVFSGVPGGTHALKITTTGYAAFEYFVDMPSSYDNTPVTANIGMVALGKAFDLKVVTTTDGTLIAGATIFVESVYYSFAPGCEGKTVTPNGIRQSVIFSSSSGPHMTSAVTDANGIATLKGLNQCSQYVVIAPAYDANKDGIYDYKTAAILYDGAINSDKALSLPMQPVLRDDAIAIVATSVDRRSRVQFYGYNEAISREASGAAYDTRSSGANAPLKVVFNYPVSLSGSMTASYADNLVDTTPLDLVASLDSTGTVLTVTPPAGGFPKNRVVTINGQITAQVNGVTSNFGGLPIYVADDTATGIGPTIALSVDNYNGTTTSSRSAYLEFPEYVTGTIRLISRTSGSVTVALSGAPISIWPSNWSGTTGSAAMVYTQGTCSSCGTGDGVLYRVNTGEYLADGDKIKVAVDVVDAEGNRLAKEFELTVE